MYIRYGGKKINKINPREFKTDLNTLALFQFAMTILLLGGAAIIGDWTMTACAIVMFPLNIAACYRLLFQAIGEFDSYAKILNVTTVVTSITNIGLLLLKYLTEYQYYIVAYVIIDFCIMFCCIALFRRKIPRDFEQESEWFSLQVLDENIKNGIFVMLGNYSSMILTGMDRWFIKALMNNTAFAMYSFAVSIEGVLNVAVMPISATLYNYFCLHTNECELKRIKNKIILFATIVVSCSFPAKFVLEILLPHYMEATSVIFYLFAAQVFYIIIKCFYVNLYKAQKKQKIYFIKLTFVIGIGFVLNAVLYMVTHTKEAFAIGTMLCGVIWLLISERDFNSIRFSKKEMLYLSITTVGYIFIGTTFESILGMVCYVALVGFLAIMLMKDDLMDCIREAKNIIEKFKKDERNDFNY